MLEDEENQLHVVTPGEGKTPINLAFFEDWDVKAFPMTEAEGMEGRTRRINAVLDKAGLTEEEDKMKCRAALAYSSSGYSIVMARDIDALIVNNYNNEITRAWDGNTDY